MLACISKDPKTLRARKAICKNRLAYSVKLVFSYVVKGIKNKITAKFSGTERLRFEDTKRIMSPQKFRDFRETGPWGPFLESPETLQSLLFLFPLQHMKRPALQNKQVVILRMAFRDFRETGPWSGRRSVKKKK